MKMNFTIFSDETEFKRSIQIKSRKRKRSFFMINTYIYFISKFFMFM